MEATPGEIMYALYYERVSTHHVEQEESMENQRKLCESYLKRHQNIVLAEDMDSYSEKISGKSDERPKFQQMLKRLERGDIRYVLVKDFKRLSRSQEISAGIKNHAKEYNYKFILLSTGQIYDPNDGQNRMMYGFESLLNEEVVYRQSEYGRIAHRQKCEEKRLNRSNVTFGYMYDDQKKDIVIDEEQAEVVHKIFDLYVFRNYSVTDIRKYLYGEGINYSVNTIRRWLSETAYIGVFHLNKKGSELGVGKGKKTRHFDNPKDEWVPVERPDLVIMDKQIFDLAQRIREKRLNHFDSAKKKSGKDYKQGRFMGTHLFSGKLFCGECGKSYHFGYADRRKTMGVYRDSVRKKDYSIVCPNQEYARVYEDDLIDITISAVNHSIEDNKDGINTLERVIERVIRDDYANLSQIKSLERKRNRLIEEANRIVNKVLDVSEALQSALDKKYNEIMAEAAAIQQKIEVIKSQKKKEEDIQAQIERARAVIQKWSLINRDNFNRDVVNAFIDEMRMFKDGRLDIVLKTDNMSEEQVIKATVPNQGRSRRGSSFVADKENVLSYQDKLLELRKVLHGSEGTNLVSIGQYSYSMKLKEQRDKTNPHLDVKVQIEISNENRLTSK